MKILKIDLACLLLVLQHLIRIALAWQELSSYDKKCPRITRIALKWQICSRMRCAYKSCVMCNSQFSITMQHLQTTTHSFSEEWATLLEEWFIFSLINARVYASIAPTVISFLLFQHHCVRLVSVYTLLALLLTGSTLGK